MPYLGQSRRFVKIDSLLQKECLKSEIEEREGSKLTLQPIILSVIRIPCFGYENVQQDDSWHEARG